MGKKLDRITKNSEKKKREDFDLWIYDSDLNDVIQVFVRSQGDSKSTNS